MQIINATIIEYTPGTVQGYPVMKPVNTLTFTDEQEAADYFHEHATEKFMTGFINYENRLSDDPFSQPFISNL